MNLNRTTPYRGGKAGKPLEQPIKFGKFPPNPYGLYDMIGNVSEYCLDWHGPYPQEKQIDPRGSEKP